MKKIFITLSAAALLLGTPAAQAAFVSQPVAVVAGASSASATTSATSVATLEASAPVATKMVTAKKKGFFARLKTLLAASGKNQIVAAILAWFLGFLGVHRFYLGYTWQGVVQLLTLGGLGIWALIDFIRILIGDLQPKDGSYDKTI